MCLAIPGKVIHVNKCSVIIQYSSEKIEANSLGINLSPGDYVFVQGGFVVEKIPPEEALESLKLWREQI